MEQSTISYCAYYTSIFINLKYAYMDYYALEQIEQEKQSVRAESESPLLKRAHDIQREFRKYSLDHLEIVLTDDLCLSICKIVIDGKKDTRSLKCLKSYLRNNTSKHPEMHLDKRFKDDAPFIRDLKKYRDCCVAHDIPIESLPHLPKDQIWDLLEQIRAALNEAYYPDLSENVVPFPDSLRDSIKSREQYGIKMLMSLPPIGNETR